jgi:hypothetical protein
VLETVLTRAAALQRTLDGALSVSAELEAPLLASLSACGSLLGVVLVAAFNRGFALKAWRAGGATRSALALVACGPAGAGGPPAATGALREHPLGADEAARLAASAGSLGPPLRASLLRELCGGEPDAVGPANHHQVALWLLPLLPAEPTLVTEMDASMLAALVLAAVDEDQASAAAPLQIALTRLRQVLPQGGPAGARALALLLAGPSHVVLGALYPDPALDAMAQVRGGWAAGLAARAASLDKPARAVICERLVRALSPEEIGPEPTLARPYAALLAALDPAQAGPAFVRLLARGTALSAAAALSRDDLVHLAASTITADPEPAGGGGGGGDDDLARAAALALLGNPGLAALTPAQRVTQLIQVIKAKAPMSIPGDALYLLARSPHREAASFAVDVAPRHDIPLLRRLTQAVGLGPDAPLFERVRDLLAQAVGNINRPKDEIDASQVEIPDPWFKERAVIIAKF